MKKYFVLTVVSAALIFTISSCSKTGPASPLSTGSLEGYVTILDQYGFKVTNTNSNLNTGKVNIASLNTTANANSTGFYNFPTLKTGVYTLLYSDTGCGSVLVNDYSFLGGGTIVRNQTLSLIPSFSLFNVTDTIVTFSTDTGVAIRGIDSVNGVARTFIVFGGTASTVSSTPGTYVYANTGTIKAGLGTFSLFMTSQELHDAGLASGSTAYFTVYPYSTGQPTYVDLLTGKTVYTALGTPSQVLQVVIP